MCVVINRNYTNLKELIIRRKKTLKSQLKMAEAEFWLTSQCLLCKTSTTCSTCNSFQSGYCNLQCMAHSLAFNGYHYILKAFMWWVSFHIFPFTLLCLEVKVICSRITGSQCTHSYVSEQPLSWDQNECGA